MTMTAPDRDSVRSATGPTRRSILRQGVAALGLSVVGWSATEGRWATAADSVKSVDALPSLAGSVQLNAGGFDHDFGGFVSAKPWAVLLPRNASDVAAMLRYCSVRGIKVAMNGQSGQSGELESHSNYGQALTSGGLQIDARSLAAVHSISKQSAVVGPGVTWAEVLERALPLGATVATLPDYLNISVGGTVSVGGVGGNVQRFGLSSDLVTEIEIVTPTGGVTRASRSRNQALFLAALAGGGQYGIITKLSIGLIPAHTTATITSLYYSDLDTYLADQRILLQTKVFDHHGGELLRSADDSSWGFKIDLGVYHSTATAPVPAILATLRDEASRRETFSLPYADWAYRVAPFAAEMVRGGYWNQRKPWLSLLIPGDKASAFMQKILPLLSARDLGAGFCLLAPINPSLLRSPNFVLPASGDGTVFFFDLLAFPHPDESGIDAMLERNRRFYDLLVSMGGKRYIIGAIPRMGIEDWKRHYGSTRYAVLRTLKRAVDPAFILTPGQGIFR